MFGFYPLLHFISISFFQVFPLYHSFALSKEVQWYTNRWFLIKILPRVSISNQILVHTHINGHGGSGIVFRCAIIYGFGGVLSVALLSKKSDGTFEMVVWYLTVLETACSILSSFLSLVVF